MRTNFDDCAGVTVCITDIIGISSSATSVHQFLSVFSIILHVAIQFI